MRARIPVTVGVSSVLGLALSPAAGSARATVLALCGVAAGALVFGGWVLSADERTARLVRLIEALRGRSGRHPKDRQK
jgi:hypothetical protein